MNEILLTRPRLHLSNFSFPFPLLTVIQLTVKCFTSKTDDNFMNIFVEANEWREISLLWQTLKL